jgi:hypothetical protein
MSDLTWTSAAPLWAEDSGGDLNGLSEPTILRFASDAFMDEFHGVLENQPAHLADYRAWPETWQDPLPQPSPVPALPNGLRELMRKRLSSGLNLPALLPRADFSDAARPLKLYQPAHQRYYLVTSSLVCRQVGLPDRAVDTSAQERATFVIRRRMLANPQDFSAANPPPAPDQAPAATYDEYALVDGQWQKTAAGKTLVAGEEQIPLFAVCYPQADGRRRRLFGGIIPVSRREAYMSAARQEASPAAAPVVAGTPAPDARFEPLLRRTFFAPWQHLLESVDDTVEKMKYSRSNTDDLAKTKLAQQQTFIDKRLQIQESSWYLLLDFADFLERNMKAVLDALKGTASLTSAEQAAVNALNAVILPPAMQTAIHQVYGVNPSASLGAALAHIQAWRDQLESASSPYTGTGRGSAWPDFLFPLADLAIWNASAEWEPALNFPRKAPAADFPPSTSLDDQLKQLEDLLGVLLAALPVQGAVRLPPVPLAAQISTTINETGWFVARCVLERPNCLPVPEAVISDPTPAFQLAGFFDPDAPARPIRIALPVDTTPAGLRKFDKNTAFLISDVLCGQVKKARGLGLIDLIMSVLPWPLHKDLSTDMAPCADSIGMICSLSIPIVTICALILLLIIVSLLDIIFKWMPFLILCFPLPKFSAKKANP